MAQIGNPIPGPERTIIPEREPVPEPVFVPERTTSPLPEPSVPLPDPVPAAP